MRWVPDRTALVAVTLLLVLLLPGSLAQGTSGGPGGGGEVVDVSQTGTSGLEQGLPLWGVAAVVAGLLLLAWAGFRRIHRGIPKAETPSAEMPLEDHLRELQHRLLIVFAFWGFFVLFFFTFGPGSVTVAGYTFPASVPTITESYSALVLDHMREAFVPPNVELVVFRPLDAVLTELTITIFLGFLAVTPLIAYEIGSFLAPGLNDDEKRIILRNVPLVTFLFLLGTLFAYLYMVPVTMDILYGYATAIGARELIHLPELVRFAVLLMLLFGLAFELPVVMAALSEFGLVHPDTYVTYWRHAVVVIAIVAAVVSDPTIVSQLLVGGPLLLLYLIGILAARWRYGKRAEELDPVLAPSD